LWGDWSCRKITPAAHLFGLNDHISNFVLELPEALANLSPAVVEFTPKAFANFSPAVVEFTPKAFANSSPAVVEFTPKAFANLSPAVGAQRQPWEARIYQV
jgi:hypothetical protein